MTNVNILYPSFNDQTFTLLSKEPLKSNSFVEFSKKTCVEVKAVTAPVCLKLFYLILLIFNFYNFFYIERSEIKFTRKNLKY